MQQTTVHPNRCRCLVIAVGVNKVRGSSADLKKRSVFLEHDLGRLYDHLHSVAFLKRHVLSAPSRDYALDEVLANAYCDVCHHSAKLDFFDGSFELITGRKSHATSLVQLP